MKTKYIYYLSQGWDGQYVVKKAELAKMSEKYYTTIILSNNYFHSARAANIALQQVLTVIRNWKH
jgi:hypothetical protein